MLSMKSPPPLPSSSSSSPLLLFLVLASCSGGDSMGTPDPDASPECVGDSCEEDPGCQSGSCPVETIAEGQDSPTGITVTSDWIVWTNEGNTVAPATGSVVKCESQSCETPVTVYSEYGKARAPQLVGDELYFLAAAAEQVNGQLVRSMPWHGHIDGRAIGPSMVSATFRHETVSLIATQAEIYFGFFEINEGSKDGVIGTCSLSSCLDDGESFYVMANEMTGSVALVVDNQFLYYSDVGTATISRSDRTSAETTELFTGQIAVFNILQDDTHLYWGTSLPSQTGVEINNYLARGPKQPGAQREKLAEVDEIVAIAMDGTWLYFAESTGKVSRIAKSGGDVEVLATEQANISDLVLHGDYLYWVTKKSDGGVFRQHLPH